MYIPWIPWIPGIPWQQISHICQSGILAILLTSYHLFTETTGNYKPPTCFQVRLRVCHRWTKQLIFAEIRPGNSTNKLHSMVWIFVERMVNTGMNVYPHVNTCLLNRADRSTSTNKVYPSNIDITPSPPPLSLHIRFHQPAGMSRVGGSQNWSRQVIGSTVRIWSPWIRSFQNVPGI